MHSFLIAAIPLLLGVIGIALWYGVALLGQRIGKAQDKRAAQLEQIWAAEQPPSEIRATALSTAITTLVSAVLVSMLVSLFFLKQSKQPVHFVWDVLLVVAFGACILLIGTQLLWTTRLWIAYGVTSPWSRPAIRLNAEGIRYFDQVQIPWSDVLETRVITIVTRTVANYVVLFTPHPVGTYSTSEMPSPKLTLLTDEQKKDEFFGYLVKAPSPYFLAIQPELLANVQPKQLRVWIDELRKKASAVRTESSAAPTGLAAPHTP